MCSSWFSFVAVGTFISFLFLKLSARKKFASWLLYVTVHEFINMMCLSKMVWSNIEEWRFVFIRSDEHTRCCSFHVFVISVCVFVWRDTLRPMQNDTCECVFVCVWVCGLYVNAWRIREGTYYERAVDTRLLCVDFSVYLSEYERRCVCEFHTVSIQTHGYWNATSVGLGKPNKTW